MTVVLFDLSADLDCINHSMYSSRFTSYLTEHYQSMKVGSSGLCKLLFGL